MVQKAERVAVVGGGIAGHGAAWTLAKSGIEVELFEARDYAGGSARSHEWSSTSDNGPVHSGLSVLAWPPAYFRHYEKMLTELGVRTQAVDLRFFVRVDEGAAPGVPAGTFVHGQPSPLREHFAKDLDAWQRMIEFVRRWSGGNKDQPSFYEVSSTNLFNFVPLRRVARLFGVSPGFWDTVVAAIYGSTFLTDELDSVPAVIAPVVDDIIPLCNGGTLKSWVGCPGDVFDAVARCLPPGAVHVGCRVSGVTLPEQQGGQVVIESKGSGGEPVISRFDRVIFACSALEVCDITQNLTTAQRQLLSRVEYDDRGPVENVYHHAVAHTDSDIIDPRDREHVLSSCCNYIRVSPPRKGHARPTYSDTFVISSWLPQLSGTPATERVPMLVTYNGGGEGSGVPAPAKNKIERPVPHYRMHPLLSYKNLAISSALWIAQGARGANFCGSSVTPGNGHDLSLLSGIIMAHAVGAAYPFPEGDNMTKRDFNLFKHRMIGGSPLPPNPAKDRSRL